MHIEPKIDLAPEILMIVVAIVVLVVVGCLRDFSSLGLIELKSFVNRPSLHVSRPLLFSPTRPGTGPQRSAILEKNVEGGCQAKLNRDFA